MGIVVPEIFTPIHQEEVKFERSISTGTLLKIIRNINWSINMIPVGTIAWFNTNLDRCPLPDPAFWQLCNGAEIVNPDSPLRTNPATPHLPKATPDIKGKYFRISSDEISNPIVAGEYPGQVGNQYHDFRHNHGGSTGAAGGGVKRDDNDDKYGEKSHTHPIAEDLEDNVFVDAPKYIYLSAYLKIV